MDFCKPEVELISNLLNVNQRIANAEDVGDRAGVWLSMNEKHPQSLRKGHDVCVNGE